jgi:hypothetical protein
MTPEERAAKFLGGTAFEAKDPADAELAELATRGMIFCYAEVIREAEAAARASAFEEAARIVEQEGEADAKEGLHQAYSASIEYAAAIREKAKE